MIEKVKGKKEYTILRELHRGGFGITYLAKGIVNDGNIPHECHYTIKELFVSNYCQRNPDNSVCAHSPEAEATFQAAKKKFLEEARILHRLSHTNIVPVNEVFEQNGTAYYVMEYLGDTSLQQYVFDKGGCLSEEHAVSIIRTVCNAVSHLHQNGILHLDIKPDNIMMYNGKPYLIDFGQAMFFKNGKAGSKSLIGGYSKGFSSAELRQGTISTFRRDLDIYSIAATLYFMLTGEVPEEAATLTKKKIYIGLPDSTSDSICSAISAAMSPYREERPADINAFVQLLGQGGGASTEKIITTDDKVSYKKWIYAATGILAAGLIVWAIIKVPTPTPTPTPNPAPADTTTTAIRDTTEKDSPIENPTELEQEEKAEEKEDTIEAKPEPKPEPRQKPAPEPREGTLNLGYATWTGGIKGGKPNGKGTMRFTRAHSIEGCQEEALPGDYVKGFCEDGTLSSGALYRDGEKIESFVR